MDQSDTSKREKWYRRKREQCDGKKKEQWSQRKWDQWNKKKRELGVNIRLHHGSFKLRYGSWDQIKTTRGECWEITMTTSKNSIRTWLSFVEIAKTIYRFTGINKLISVQALDFVQVDLPLRYLDLSAIAHRWPLLLYQTEDGNDSDSFHSQIPVTETWQNVGCLLHASCQLPIWITRRLHSPLQSSAQWEHMWDTSWVLPCSGSKCCTPWIFKKYIISSKKSRFFPRKRLRPSLKES